MKRTVFAVLLLVASITALFAQETDQEWFWNKPIQSVQWEGLGRANRNELDSLLRNYVGQQFTQDLWLEIQSKLYELDWFDSIEPQAIPVDDAKGKLIIRFVVKEKPAILSVKYVGNSGVRVSDLSGVVTSKAGDIYNSAKASLDVVAIQKLYNEKGYPDAQISQETAAADDPGLLVLTFKITEGAQVAIKSIRFTGNDSVSERTLRQQMTLKEAALFQPGTFQNAKLEESKKAILDYYQSKGFVDAKILDTFQEFEKDENTGKNWLALTISISEGRQWKFGGVSFSGNKVISSDKLEALISLKPGSTLNYKRLVLDKAKIDDLYYESGYIFNQIGITEKRDDADGSIRYTVDIVERDRAHIESLTFTGNEKTKEFVLAREVPLEAGDIFSKTKIIDGLRNLYNLQYFSTVEPQIKQGSAENLMDLVIAVQETSTAEIQFGVTLSGLGQVGTFPLSGFVKWNDRNLGGMGQNLQVNTTLSPTEQSLDTSFSEGWLFGKRISRSLSLSFKHSSETTGQDILAPVFQNQDIPDPFDSLDTGSNAWTGSLSSIPSEYLMPYENWSTSLGFNLGYTYKSRIGDIGAAGGISSGIGMISYDESKYRPYEAEFRDTNKQWLLTNRIFARAYINNLDLWYNPGSGYFASQRLTFTGFLPFERQHYIKTDTRLDAYATLFTVPLSDTWNFKWVLMAHSGFQALFAEPWAPFTVTKDWVSLDGTFNVRGWNELYGSKGIALWENSLELRMPVVDQMLWMDLFVDAGAMQTQTGLVDMTLDTPAADAARPNFGSLGWTNLALSAGVGFRFTVPQFPFRFYFVKRFTFDGSTLVSKTPGTNFDFVLSITQPLY